MKKTIVIHFIALILLASSCEKVDLSEVNNRLDKLENPVVEIKPKLNSITFLAKDNVESLIGDVQGEVIGDSIVECWCHYFMKDKYLVPQIVWSGQTITIDGSPYEEENAYDFKKPVVITIGNGDEEILYKVYVHAFTGLPIMEIDTDGRMDITSKEEYQHASLVLKEDVITRAPGDIFQEGVNIKGRGNATWTLYPKKPYRLKFDQKVALLGEKEDKSWVLLANYADKTMMRTQIASFIGKMSLLEYTPSFHFVELILNGKLLVMR